MTRVALTCLRSGHTELLGKNLNAASLELLQIGQEISCSMAWGAKPGNVQKSPLGHSRSSAGWIHTRRSSQTLAGTWLGFCLASSTACDEALSASSSWGITGG